MNLEDCIQIGVISRTHGTQGELVLSVQEESFIDTIFQQESIFLQMPENEEVLVPFFIDTIREKNTKQLLLSFLDYGSLESVDYLLNRKTFLPKNLLSDNFSNELYSIEGYSVIDKDQGYLGKVSQLLNFSGNKLIEVKNETSEILIPVNEESIINIDDKSKEVIINIPKELIYLNS